MKLTPEEKEELKKLGIDVDAEGESDEEFKASGPGSEEPDEELGEEDSEEGSDADAEGGDSEPEESDEESESGKDKEPLGRAPGSLEDDARTRRLEERLAYYEEREARQLEEAAQARARQQQEEKKEEKKEEREAQYVLTDVHQEEFNARLERLEKREKLFVQNAVKQESQTADKAAKIVAAKYPDFDKYVKPEYRKQALDAVASNPDQIGSVDWEVEYVKAYKQAAFDELFNKSSELERKREEKKAKEKKMVRKVLPSGSSFQAPVTRTSNSSGAPESYKTVRGEAMQILRGE